MSELDNNLTTEIFALWFGKFCKTVTQRPLLLIFDGHLTHVSVAVIEKGLAENVFIVKLLLQVTDVLQPLNKNENGKMFSTYLQMTTEPKKQ